MRTLTLLTALLLLAFQAQAQAQTLQETTDQVPTQDQSGVEDQDLLGDEDQDVAISFTGEERFTRQLTSLGIGEAVVKAAVTRCRCQQQHQCPNSKVNKVLERISWACRIFGRTYKLCCK